MAMVAMGCRGGGRVVAQSTCGGGGSRRRHLHVKLSMKILYSMKGSNVLEKNKIKILRVQILMTGYLLALLLLCVIKIVSCVRKILMV